MRHFDNFSNTVRWNFGIFSVNIFRLFRGNLTSRIVWTLLIEVLVFVVTIILAMVDSSEWPGIFFYLTIGCVILLNSTQSNHTNSRDFNLFFLHLLSCIWHLPKYRVWLSSQAAFQVHWSCCPRISKYFDLAKKFVNSNELLSFRI